MPARQTRVRLVALVVAAAALIGAAPRAADDPPATGTRLLRTPTVSATHIAFAYASNIWIVERAGGTARRVTSFQGQASNPQLSPDGRQLAFSADYAGNPDVYVVPVDGGEPTRLTWHPGPDLVQGWTPDGTRVLFTSPRATASPAVTPRFWTVPVAGGPEAPLALPRGYQGKLSPDGRRIAYRMNSSWDEERRNYRGGQNKAIWIVDLASHDAGHAAVVRARRRWIRCGSATPSTSCRIATASSNVWAFVAGHQAAHAGHARSPTSTSRRSAPAAGTLVFEQAGHVHELDPKTGEAGASVPIRAAGDFPWMMPHWEDVTARMTNLGAVAHRQARGRRGARRDLHDPRRQGRRAQPDRVERLGRARAGVVARRQVRVVLQRRRAASTGW